MAVSRKDLYECRDIYFKWITFLITGGVVESPGFRIPNVNDIRNEMFGWYWSTCHVLSHEDGIDADRFRIKANALAEEIYKVLNDIGGCRKQPWGRKKLRGETSTMRDISEEHANQIRDEALTLLSYP